MHEDDPAEPEILNQEIMAMGIKDGTAWATDDVKGVSLDPKLVEEARKLEIEWFNARGVYTNVSRQHAMGAQDYSMSLGVREQGRCWDPRLQKPHCRQRVRNRG